MRQWIEKGNTWQRLLREWKDKQGIESLDPDEMREVLEEVGDAIIEYKMDGELSFFHKSGDNVLFASLGGRIRKDLPVLEIMRDRLSKAGYDKIQIIGELIGLDEKGYPLRFNETMSIIRDPTEEEEWRISFYPFEVYSVEGKRIDNKDLDEYERWMKRLDEIFKSVDLVRPVYRKRGSVKEFNQMWYEWAEKQKQEGLVIRTVDGKIYKVKTVFNFDAVIIFMTEGTKRLKGMLGAAGVALMDNDEIFRYIGLVGTGWTDEIREELWDWGLNNEVDILDEEFEYPPKLSSEKLERLIWVKPYHIIEIAWKDILMHEVPGYSFSRGRYYFEGFFPSVIMREPRFVRFREDKEVNPEDLRLTQIPDWRKRLREFERQKEE
jgi:ATP-dependent DNA ligase